MLMQTAITAAGPLLALRSNDNCVQDAQARLRAALALASRYYGPADFAPTYVARRISDLLDWLN